MNMNASYSFSRRNPLHSLSRDSKYVISTSLNSLDDAEEIQKAQIDQIDTLIDSQKNYINTLKTKYEDLENRHKNILNELITFKSGKNVELASDNLILKKDLLEEKKMRICAEVQLDILSHLLEYEMNEIHRCKALTSTVTEDKIKLAEELRTAKLREESLNNEISRLRERAGRLIADSSNLKSINVQYQNNIQTIPVFLIWCRERGQKIYLGDMEVISKYLQKLDLDAQIWAFCIDKLASLNPRLQHPKFMKGSYDDYNDMDIFSKKTKDFRIYSQNLSLFEVGEDSWNPGKVPFDIEPIYMRSVKNNQIRVYLKDKITHTMECMLPVDVMDNYSNSLMRNKLTMFLFESNCENWLKNFMISLVKVTKDQLTNHKEQFYYLTNVIAVSSEGIIEFLIDEKILITEKKVDWGDEESRLILLIHWSSELDPDLTKPNADLEELEDILNFLLFNLDSFESIGYPLVPLKKACEDNQNKGQKYYFSSTQIHVTIIVPNSRQSVFASTSPFTMRNKFFSTVDSIRVEETEDIEKYNFPKFPMVYVSESLVHATIYKLISWNHIKRMWRRADKERTESSVCECLVLSKILKLWEMIYEPLLNLEKQLTIMFDKCLPWFTSETYHEQTEKNLIAKFIKWLAVFWNEVISHEIIKFHAFYTINGWLAKATHESKNCTRQVYNLLIEPILFDIEQRIPVDRNIFIIGPKNQAEEGINSNKFRPPQNSLRPKRDVDENTPRIISIPRPSKSKHTPVQSMSGPQSSNTSKSRPLSGQNINRPRDSSLTKTSMNRAFSLRHSANRQISKAPINSAINVIPRPTLSDNQGPSLSMSLNKLNKK